MSGFLPICGQEYSDRYLLYVLLAVGAGGSITSVQCIEPVTRGGKQIGRTPQEAADTEESKMCPLAHDFDLQIHDAIENLRRLDGSIPPHKDHGRSVDFFTEKGKRKFWLKSRTPVFGYMFSGFHTLDKVVCPFLSDAFGQAIWHPRSVAELDKLVDAKVPV